MVKASTTDVNIRFSPKFLAALQRACLSALVSTVRGITRGVRATTLILACASRMSTGCMSEPVRERERERERECVCVRACVSFDLFGKQVDLRHLHNAMCRRLVQVNGRRRLECAESDA